MNRREFLVLVTAFFGGCKVYYGSEFRTSSKARRKEEFEDNALLKRMEKIREEEMKRIRMRRKQEEEKKRLARVEYDSTLTEYTRRYNTIAHRVLDVEKELGTVPADYKFIDDFIDKVKERIKVKDGHITNDTINEPERILRTIKEILEYNGFTYKDSLLLNPALETRKIDCDTITYLYLAAAEEINLPLFAVSIPGHVFARFKSEEGKYFNWECTSGDYVDNDYYIKKYNLSNLTINLGNYLRDLNHQETLANAHCAVGRAWEEKGELEKALKEYMIAEKLDPRDPEYSCSKEKISNLLEAKEIKQDTEKLEESVEQELERIEKENPQIEIKPYQKPAIGRQQKKQDDYFYKITGYWVVDTMILTGIIHTTLTVSGAIIHYFRNRNKPEAGSGEGLQNKPEDDRQE